MSTPASPFAVAGPGAFSGVFLAKVENIADPQGLSRVQVRLPGCANVDNQDGLIWARVVCPFAGANRGTFFLPDVGDEVLVAFLSGMPEYPYVLGGLWSNSAPAPASIDGSTNRLKVIRSRNGVQLTLDDSDGQERFIVETPGGQKLTLKDGPGSVVIEDSNGNSIKLETTGITIDTPSKVAVHASQVDVSAGMVKVDAAMSQFSGVVKCETLLATTVVGSAYTPGAGNVW